MEQKRSLVTKEVIIRYEPSGQKPVIIQLPLLERLALLAEGDSAAQEAIAWFSELDDKTKVKVIAQALWFQSYKSLVKYQRMLDNDG